MNVLLLPTFPANPWEAIPSGEEVLPEAELALHLPGRLDQLHDLCIGHVATPCQ